MSNSIKVPIALLDDSADYLTAEYRLVIQA